MAQGGFKSKKSGNSKPGKRPNKKKQQKQKQLGKGRKSFAAKGRKATQAKDAIETTKAINSKNETIVAARAVGSGSRFYLNDIKDAGKKEIGRQRTNLKKKETKSMRMSERLQLKLDQLK